MKNVPNLRKKSQSFKITRYNGNFDITRMLDQSNLSTQRCRLIFWVECSVGGYIFGFGKDYMHYSRPAVL
jgi:hypothetical protein